MASIVKHLLAGAVAPAAGEVFDELLRRGPVRIERIISSAAPEDVLYDQPQDEWVLLLQGEAGLWVEGDELRLSAGDALFIPAHTRHRVTATAGDPPCIWLAVHIEAR